MSSPIRITFTCTGDLFQEYPSLSVLESLSLPPAHNASPDQKLLTIKVKSPKKEFGPTPPGTRFSVNLHIQYIYIYIYIYIDIYM
jgi:hypothetical protein